MAYVYYDPEDLSIQFLTMHDLDEPWPRFDYPDDEILPFLAGEKSVAKYRIRMVDSKPVIEPKPVQIQYPNIDYRMYRATETDSPIAVVRRKNKVSISLKDDAVPTVRRYPRLYFTEPYNAHVLYHAIELDLQELNKERTLTYELPNIPSASLYYNRFVDMSYEETL